jgi:hypothetical protein
VDETEEENTYVDKLGCHPFENKETENLTKNNRKGPMGRCVIHFV